jgi:hypothetical protein
VPRCLVNLFTRALFVHSHCTRNVYYNFFVLTLKVSVFKASFVSYGIRKWNQLDISLRSTFRLSVFKTAVLNEL